MNWIIYALLSRFFWAADNIVDKFIAGKYIKDSYVLTLLGGIAPLFIAAVIFFTSKLNHLELTATSIILFAGMIQIIAVFAFYRALLKEEVSRVIPLFQFTPIFVFILSFIFLKETLTIKQSSGFFLILLGGIFISIKKIKGLFTLGEAFWWMLLSSFIYAVQAVMGKAFYMAYSFVIVTFYLSIGMFIPTLLLLIFSNKLRNKFTKELSNLPKKGWLIVSIKILFVAFAFFTSFLAFSTGLVSIISALRGFQSVFVLVFAIILSLWLPKILKEELAGRVLLTKILAIAIMLVGLYFIT